MQDILIANGRDRSSPAHIVAVVRCPHTVKVCSHKPYQTFLVPLVNIHSNLDDGFTQILCFHGELAKHWKNETLWETLHKSFLGGCLPTKAPKLHIPCIQHKFTFSTTASLSMTTSCKNGKGGHLLFVDSIASSTSWNSTTDYAGCQLHGQRSF